MKFELEQIETEANSQETEVEEAEETKEQIKIREETYDEVIASIQQDSEIIKTVSDNISKLEQDKEVQNDKIQELQSSVESLHDRLSEELQNIEEERNTLAMLTECGEDVSEAQKILDDREKYILEVEERLQEIADRLDLSLAELEARIISPVVSSEKAAITEENAKEKEVEEAENQDKRFENSSEKRSQVETEADKWKSRLTDEEYAAVRDYTRSDPPYYENINAKLRGKALFFDKGNRERAILIHSALQKIQLPCDCTVYRGTTIDALGKYKNLSDDELVGKVLLDKGFMSTSINKGSEFGGEVKLEILAPAGSKGAYLSKGISAVGEAEYEVLFDKGSRLKIIDVSHNMWGKRIIRARLM